MPIFVRGTELPPAPGFDVGTAFSGPPGVLLHSGGPAVMRALAVSPSDAALSTLVADRLADGAASTSAAASRSAAASGVDTVAVPSPEHALALDALRLVQLIDGPARRPARWSSRSFNREVDLVRAHLRPIRTRVSLAASFGREAFHGRAPAGTDRALNGSAVRVAYAIRWLELGEQADRPSWRAWLEQGAPAQRPPARQMLERRLRAHGGP